MSLFSCFPDDNNIVILGYPSCCSHVLLELNVVCFTKMKREFWMEIYKFKDLHMALITKADFVGMFEHAFLHTFTSKSIKAAFSATGIYPFNPAAITDKKMTTSLPTSTKSTFPLQQSSPI